LGLETEAIRGLREECEALRTQIDTERDAAEQKYADLERNRADEKETALAVEKSLRVHYETLNAEWQRFVICPSPFSDLSLNVCLLIVK
jgi:hypothetical protein